MENGFVQAHAWHKKDEVTLNACFTEKACDFVTDCHGGSGEAENVVVLEQDQILPHFLLM